MGKPGISVPKEFKNELRNTSSPEYKIAQIRDYVKAHENKIIRGEEFRDLVGSMASTYIGKLRREGRLIRISVKDGTKGLKFKWKWIDKDHVVDAKPSEVRVKTLGFKDYAFGREETTFRVTAKIDEFVLENVYKLSGDEIRGLIKFKDAHLKNHEEVKKHNDILLEKQLEEE